MAPCLNMLWRLIVVALTREAYGADNPNIATDGLLPTRGLPRTRLQGMLLNQRDRIQCHMRSDSYFPCRLAHTDARRSPSRPYSVHRLRPGDIQIVANLGDSLSAGTGALARSALQVAVEYRGVAWSGGGLGNWKEYVTLPNILKNFNPNVYGYSTRNTLIPKMQNEDVFNVADTGATSGDLPAQAKRLITLMRQDPKVNYTQDWKMVTIMIGGNDVCSHSCSGHRPDNKDREDASVSAFVTNIQRTLDILQRDMPRTFVNLVPPPDLGILLDIYDRPLACRKFNKYACPCLYDEKFYNVKTAPEIRGILTGYLRAMEKLLASGRYYARDDFTVVLQPFLIQPMVPMTIPRQGGRPQPDLSFFAPDCFHFAQKLHAAAARGLWNNLLEPVGTKTPSNGIDDPFLCPTEENPFLATVRNSGYRALQMQSLAVDYLNTMTRMAKMGPIDCSL